MPTTAEPFAGKQAVRPNLVLAICCMSLLLTGMDVTIVNVALPAVQGSLHATLSQLQWIIDSYTLVVASFLMFAGSLSDRFGRKRAFQAGLVLFTGGSMLCSIAPDIGSLILFRAVQGLGASMLNPVALSIIANAFSEPKARSRALGIWGATAGLAFGLGPLLGGILTETVGWRAIFWVNVPIGIAAMVLAIRFVPESKAGRARPFDPLGQLLVFLVLLSVTYGVIESPHAGWHSPLIGGLFGVAVAALAAFLLYESRIREPLLDLRFFRSVPFTSATLLAGNSFAVFAGFLFLNALYLQQVRGFSAFRTGLYTLPMAVVILLTAPVSGRLVGAYGTRPSVLLSGAGFLFGTLMLTRLGPDTSFSFLMAAYVLLGVGVGMINPAVGSNAVAGMPLSQAGVASAIASTSRQTGAALGVAVAGTVVTGHHALHGAAFTQATHPIWWIMAASSLLILAVGWVSTTAWARATAARQAARFAGVA